MNSLKQFIYCTVNVMAGILMFALLKEMLSCDEHRQKEFSANAIITYEPPQRAGLPPKTDSEQLKSSITRETDSFQSRLSHFGKLQGKVLLSSEESIERERLLSHQPTIDWIVSQLTNPLLDTNLKDRLSMIDYLEDAIAWEENPIRDEVIASIGSIIFSESFLRASKDIKRQLVGDKIELFTILSQEFPQKASELQEKMRGSRLEPILHYASKRLPITQSKTQE